MSTYGDQYNDLRDEVSHEHREGEEMIEHDAHGSEPIENRQHDDEEDTNSREQQQQGDLSADEAEAGIYHDEGEDDIADVRAPVPESLAALHSSSEDFAVSSNPRIHHAAAADEYNHNTNTHNEAAAANSSERRASRQSQMQVTRTRPTTADKIRIRTARLMQELAEIDKFRELRTVTKTGHSPSELSGSGSFSGATRGASNRCTASTSKNKGATTTRAVSGSPANSSSSPSLPPITGARAGGLFSETLAQSRHVAILSAATGQGSRVGTATVGGGDSSGSATVGSSQNNGSTHRSQTRGDGRAGFSSRESGIADLVQQLTNKWGR